MSYYSPCQLLDTGTGTVHAATHATEPHADPGRLCATARALVTADMEAHVEAAMTEAMVATEAMAVTGAMVVTEAMVVVGAMVVVVVVGMDVALPLVDMAARLRAAGRALTLVLDVHC